MGDETLTLLLAPHRPERSSCHCDCHYRCVSNGREANVSRPLGTSESPPALSDRRAIYLSASTSTPALPNPSFCRERRAPKENTCSHTAQKNKKKAINRMAIKSTWIAQGQVSALNNSLIIRLLCCQERQEWERANKNSTVITWKLL